MKLFKRNNTDLKKIISAIWDFWTSKTGAFLLAVSAMVIGWYQFYINRPILEYATDTVSFISSKNDNKYKVTIDGKDYRNLYLTQVILENKGAVALSGNDVSAIGHNPIRVVLPKNAKVVHYNLDKTITTKDITTSIKEVKDNLVIKFDFLNSDYAIGISILHENPSDDFKVVGSALNVNNISKEWSNKEIKFWAIWSVGILYIILVMMYLYHHWLLKIIRRFKRKQEAKEQK